VVTQPTLIPIGYKREETAMHHKTNPWGVLLVVCLGTFMTALDTTIVNVAMPSIITALQASLDQILWVVFAYTLAYAVLLITGGRLGDLFGQRAVFAAGLAIFTIASGCCGLAQDVQQLVAARVAQGVGGALLTPQVLATVTAIFPAERRGSAFGIWGATLGLGTVAGPTLGGLIVTDWSWRWIFYLNVPVGILTLLATVLVIPDLRAGRQRRLDLFGVVLASGALLAIVFGLIEGQHYNWGVIGDGITIPEVIGFGILALAAFLIWERFQAQPLLPLSLFARRNFALMSGLNLATGFGIFGFFLPLTLYLQSVLGMSALRAGLVVAMFSVVSFFVAPFGGRLADRIGGKFIIMTGLASLAAGMGLVARLVTPSSSWATFLFPLALAGFGSACVFATTAATAMRQVPPALAGAASGVLSTMLSLGGVVGAAVVGAVLQNQLALALPRRAVEYAGQVPAGLRRRFVAGFEPAGSAGLQVGAGQHTGIQLPPATSTQVAQQLQRLAHDVFASGFVDAMRPTLAVVVAVLALAALSCVAIERNSKVAKVATDAGVAVAETAVSPAA